jgi:BASS family bile acid:Na+ symporter
MPLSGWGVARLLDLPPPFAVGLILVACCPGGTASNVVSYLARANLALSVVMTLVSTLGAIVMTPLFVRAFAGAIVPVDAWGIFMTTVQVVLAPVLLGVYLNHRFPRAVAAAGIVGPLVSVAVIVMIAGSIVAQNAEAVIAHGSKLATASLLLHSLGFGLGYFLSRLFGCPPLDARTVSIEVGMQNSGLGMVLAKEHFPTEPLTAVPAAFCSIVHTLLGSLLAGYWRLRPPDAAVTPSSSTPFPSATPR